MTNERFYLGEWIVEPEFNRISKAKETWAISPRIMHFFIFFLQKPNTIIVKKILLEEVWTDRLITKDSLNKATSDLRKLLRQHFDGQLELETLRNVGYRLNSTLPISKNQPTLSEKTNPKIKTQPLFWALLTFSLIAILGFAFYRGAIPIQTVAPIALDQIPLTVTQGLENYPAISPDGKNIAFVWRQDEEVHYHIYLKELDGVNARRLTTGFETEFAPVWSLDGQYIYFIRRMGNGEKQLIRRSVISADELVWTSLDFYAILGNVARSYDGQWIAFAAKIHKNSPSSIYLLNLEKAEISQHLPTPEGIFGDLYPVFSKNNLKQLTFLRMEKAAASLLNNSPVQSSIIESELHATTTNTVLTLPQEIGSLTASPYWPEYYFYSLDKDGMYAVSKSGKTPLIREAANKGLIKHLIPLPNQKGLAFEYWIGDLVLKKLLIPEAGMISTPATAFQNSTHWEWGLDFNASGEKAVFISDRTGAQEVWLCDFPSEENARQITRINGTTIRWASISPNGEQIVFTSIDNGEEALYAIDHHGRGLQKISPDGLTVAAPTWAFNGQNIYYASNQSGDWQIWQTDQDGKNHRQISHHGGYKVIATEKGIYYSKYREAGIWWIPNNSDQSEEIIPVSLIDDRENWVVTSKGIYFLFWKDTSCALHYFNFETQQATQLLPLVGLTRDQRSLSISPDEKYLFINKWDQLHADIQMLLLQ